MKPPAGIAVPPEHEQRVRSPVEDGYWEEGRITFPLRIGVTGHRALADPSAVSTAVRAQLTNIRDQFPADETIRVRFTVLSALAEGADRLLVRDAFEVFADDDFALHAVLPLPPDDYRTDFQTVESRAEFDELLAQATSVTRTPRARNREASYERAGEWIAEHSDVVIALWDGRRSAGQGGTAEIAEYANRQGVPVLVVATARQNGLPRPPRDSTWQSNADADLESALKAYSSFKRFNAGSVNDRPRRAQIASLESHLGPAAEDTAIHWLYENVGEWALPRLARADVLALKYQRLYYRLGTGLFSLAALAVAAVAAQYVAGLDPLFALFEVGFMAVLLVMFWTGRRARVHDRWIGYRSLAEAFRSALFIHVVGSEVQIDIASKIRASEEPWFQRAFSEAWRDRPSIKPTDSDTPDLRRFIIDAWIDGQINYHERAVQRFETGRVLLTRAIFGLFTVTFVLGILHSFHIIHLKAWNDAFVFLAIALPGFGAALTGARDQRQYRLHEERSRRTANRLRILRRNMELQSSLKSVQKLAAQVQSVIEAENLDWSGVIEFQDLEMVI